jgi:hypothetical protein
MSEPDVSESKLHMIETPFQSEAEFRAALDTVITNASREIRVMDDRLERMLLDDKVRAALLAQFLAASNKRQLHIIVHDPQYAETRCPRLCGLIRRFPDAVEVRESPAALKHIADSFLIADEVHGVIRFHRDHARGKMLQNAGDDIRPWWQRFDELWRSGSSCLSPTQAGL